MGKMNKPQLARGWYCGVKNEQNVVAYMREQQNLKTGYLVLVNVGLEATSFDLATVQSASITCENADNVWADSDSSCTGGTVTLSAQGYTMLEYPVGTYQSDWQLANLAESQQTCYISRPVKLSSGIEYKVASDYWTG